MGRVAAPPLPVAYSAGVAPPRIASLFGVTNETLMLIRTWRHLRNGQRFQFAKSYMTMDTATSVGLPGMDLHPAFASTIALFRAFGVIVDAGSFHVVGRLPSDEEMEELRVASGAPVVERTRSLAVQGQPVEISVSVTAAVDVTYVTNVRIG